VKMCGHARGLRGRTGGRRRAQTGCGPEWRARTVEGKPKSRCHASGVAYEGGLTGGRVQAIPPHSGVTACNNNSMQIYNAHEVDRRRGQSTGGQMGCVND